MVGANEVLGLDATGQAELVSRRDISAMELVEAAAARLEAVNPTLNAVIHPNIDKARRSATGSLPHGPFKGVPFLVKDLIAHAAGEPFHEGLRALALAGFSRGSGYRSRSDVRRGRACDARADELLRAGPATDDRAGVLWSNA